MDRILASIQRVEWIKSIDNADRIELIGVLGWQVIVNKEYNLKINDLIVFIEIDSLLPKDNPIFDFMERTNWRVKTMKMRGVVSQGLAMSLSIIPDSYSDPLMMGAPIRIGDDVTELLNVTKHEPPAKFTRDDVKGKFPFYIHKTDEIRIQSVPELLDEIRGMDLIVTTKLDGTSMTVSHMDGEFDVCSRNLSLKESDKSVYWKMVEKYNLRRLEKQLRNFAVQGEICGPGIQKNRLGLSEIDLFVFDVYDIDSHKYLNFNELQDWIHMHGLRAVPITATIFDFDMTIDELLEKARGVYDNGHTREGIVIRPTVETYSEVLKGRLSFKVINNDFLLKTGD